MVAVAGTRDSLERVVGQRKVCHCSRGCESHYCAARVRDGAPDACHEVPRGMQFVDPKRGQKASTGGYHGLGVATSISGEHTAMGKPQSGRQSK